MKNIHASGEEYLKWILRLQKQRGFVRNIDLARHMGYSKASITLAIKQLVTNGFITKDDEGHLLLTDSGYAIAENFNERHRVLTHLLSSLGIDYSIAEADACKIEHVISEESFKKLKELDSLKAEALSAY